MTSWDVRMALRGLVAFCLFMLVGCMYVDNGRSPFSGNES